VANLTEGPGRPGPLFWVKKKEEITEGRKAGRAMKTKPALPPLSSRSGSATDLSDYFCLYKEVN